METTTQGRHASILVDRDRLVDRARHLSHFDETRPAEVPEHILAAVHTCTTAGISALRQLGVTKDLLLHEDHRWYGVHVPTGYVDDASTALTAAETDGDTTALTKLSDTLTTLAEHLSRALPPPSTRPRQANSRTPTRQRTTGRRRELTEFGNPPRFNICMFPLLSEDATNRRIIPAHTKKLRHITENIGHQFRRETGYDLTPFNAKDPNQHGVLLLSKEFEATFPIAAGAAGMSQQPDRWCLDWIWLHPYERNTGSIDDAWTELEDIFGQFLIDGPYSPAMHALIIRRAITHDRLTHPIHTQQPSVTSTEPTE